ncbi:hypothetical protein H7C19_20235 [Cohnella nanjingensis]|uniref:Uncharacterized protein n=2 Tax=Cohnella nanjingensis TaxID=1387779 RepID=A0A7X0VHU8_9BACL|nr:hypothetical protein [Cohnella nanjingensis]
MRERHVRWNIAQNPVEILLERTSKVRAGGGYRDEKSSHGPFTVRIYMASSAGANEKSSTVGTKNVSATFSLLADASADIRAGTDVTDRFEAAGVGSFEVSDVVPIMLQGEICGYQVKLEKVT